MQIPLIHSRPGTIITWSPSNGIVAVGSVYHVADEGLFVEYMVATRVLNDGIKQEVKEQRREFLSFDWLKEKQAQIIGKENINE